MAKECKKCGNPVPNHIVIDGKKSNCQRRKYCFDCSPFGHHNTRKLEEELIEKGSVVKTCPDCGDKHDQKCQRCFRCYFRSRKKQVREKVDQIVGTECWLCGYNRCRRNLCFHHVDPGTKDFGLTTRELMLKWDRVFAEMQKCVLVCGNCHGEIHEGLITESEVVTMWRERWTQIKTTTE